MEKAPTVASLEKPQEEIEAEINPIKTKPSGNHEMLEQAIDGLLGALELKGGKLSSVFRSDILKSTTMLPTTFDHYYKDAGGIMKDVYKTLGEVFISIETDIVNLPEDEKLYFLFERLWRQQKIVRIIFLIENHDVWKNYMRKSFKNIAKSWRDFDDPQWTYLYEVFCGQFESVIKKWMAVELKKEYIKECVRLTELWIETDAMVGETAAELLGVWG